MRTLTLAVAGLATLAVLGLTFAELGAADAPTDWTTVKGQIVWPGDPPKPNLYVLAMGINDYPGKLKLHYCSTDAQMLAAAFQEKSKTVFNQARNGVVLAQSPAGGSTVKKGSTVTITVGK